MHRLPENLRPQLARPFAPVLDTDAAIALARGRDIISVGDVVTQMLLDARIVPRVMIVDGVTQRMQTRAAALEHLPASGVEIVRVENPPATITPELWAALERALASKGPTLIHVIGEEDLAALPAMLLAPRDALVLYGQPHEGVVAVEVDDATRARAKVLLNSMEVK